MNPIKRTRGSIEPSMSHHDTLAMSRIPHAPLADDYYQNYPSNELERQLSVA